MTDLEKARALRFRLANMYPANTVFELSKIFGLSESAIRTVLTESGKIPPRPEPGLTSRRRGR